MRRIVCCGHFSPEKVFAASICVLIPKCPPAGLGCNMHACTHLCLSQTCTTNRSGAMESMQQAISKHRQVLQMSAINVICHYLDPCPAIGYEDVQDFQLAQGREPCHWCLLLCCLIAFLHPECYRPCFYATVKPAGEQRNPVVWQLLSKQQTLLGFCLLCRLH